LGAQIQFRGGDSAENGRGTAYGGPPNAHILQRFQPALAGGRGDPPAARGQAIALQGDLMGGAAPTPRGPFSPKLGHPKTPTRGINGRERKSQAGGPNPPPPADPRARGCSGPVEKSGRGGAGPLRYPIVPRPGGPEVGAPAEWGGKRHHGRWGASARAGTPRGGAPTGVPRGVGPPQGAPGAAAKMRGPRAPHFLTIIYGVAAILGGGEDGPPGTADGFFQPGGRALGGEGWASDGRAFGGTDGPGGFFAPAGSGRGPWHRSSGGRPAWRRAGGGKAGGQGNPGAAWWRGPASIGRRKRRGRPGGAPGHLSAGVVGGAGGGPAVHRICFEKGAGSVSESGTRGGDAGAPPPPPVGRTITAGKGTGAAFRGPKAVRGCGF